MKKQLSKYYQRNYCGFSAFYSTNTDKRVKKILHVLAFCICSCFVQFSNTLCGFKSVRCLVSGINFVQVFPRLMQGKFRLVHNAQGDNSIFTSQTTANCYKNKAKDPTRNAISGKTIRQKFRHFSP